MDILYTILFIIGLYGLLLLVIYIFQSRFIFKPQRLAQNFKYKFYLPFESFFITTTKGDKIHALWFKNEVPKGTIFFCHGSNSNMSEYESEITYYTSLGYNFFIWDYRGFGKSTGSIHNQNQFYSDAQLVFEYMVEHLEVHELTVMGYSIGTAAASKLSAQNSALVSRLILLAPYYSLSTLIKDTNFKFIPTSLLKYPFVTHKYLKNLSVPIYIFHGLVDKRIPFHHANQLKEYLKETDRLFSLAQQDHYDLHKNAVFRSEFESLI